MSKTLAEIGFRVGDLVVYDSVNVSTGGIIYKITHNCDPVVPHGTKSVPTKSRYRRGQPREVPVNARGKQISAKELNGFVRLRPVYSFFPTWRGKQPSGQHGTVLVYHDELRPAFGTSRVKRVDLLVLASKYAEFGNVLRDLAREGGMDLSSPPEAPEKTA